MLQFAGCVYYFQLGVVILFKPSFEIPFHSGLWASSTRLLRAECSPHFFPSYPFWASCLELRAKTKTTNKKDTPTWHTQDLTICLAAAEGKIPLSDVSARWLLSAKETVISCLPYDMGAWTDDLAVSLNEVLKQALEVKRKLLFGFLQDSRNLFYGAKYIGQDAMNNRTLPARWKQQYSFVHSLYFLLSLTWIRKALFVRHGIPKVNAQFNVICKQKEHISFCPHCKQEKDIPRCKLVYIKITMDLSLKTK